MSGQTKTEGTMSDQMSKIKSPEGPPSSMDDVDLLVFLTVELGITS